jgi:hypothetical protein
MNTPTVPIAPTPGVPPSQIQPGYYKYVLEVTLEFPSVQPSAPSATQIAADAQAAILADATINPNAVFVHAYVPTGSGE